MGTLSTVYFRIFYHPSPTKDLKIKISTTTILPIVLDGVETSSKILKKNIYERRFEKMTLRRNFALKKKCETGCRNLHNKETHNV